MKKFSYQQKRSMRRQIIMYRNEVIVYGTLVEKLSFHHYVRDKKIFSAKLSVKRRSGTSDILMIQISEWKLKEIEELEVGEEVGICGEIRTYTYTGRNGKIHNKNYVYIEKIWATLNIPDPNNEVKVTGKIVEKRTIRKTPSGKEIIDIRIATQSNKGNQWSYIPIIFWNETAKEVEEQYNTGDMISLVGRYQSRNYIKRYSGDVIVDKVTYEISALKLGL